jgi:hypothetical protein
LNTVPDSQGSVAHTDKDYSLEIPITFRLFVQDMNNLDDSIKIDITDLYTRNVHKGYDWSFDSLDVFDHRPNLFVIDRLGVYIFLGMDRHVKYLT